jgi:N-acetylglucosamine-6-phosphate deacetylase
MRTLIKNVSLVMPDRLIPEGWLVINDSIIEDYGWGNFPKGEFQKTLDGQGKFLSPGFVDMHIHGAKGMDFFDGTEEAITTVLQTHLQGGITTMLPSLSSLPHHRYIAFFETFNRIKDSLEARNDIPDIGGIHMEGPFIDGNVIGGMLKSACRPINMTEIETYLEMAPYIKRWTIACEYEGALALGKELDRRGMMVSIGHSDATTAQVREAYDYGFRSITHLYSSCSFYHRNGPYREGGIVEAAFLMDNLDVEIIADGCHLPKDFLQMIYKIKGPDRIALVTDASRYTAIDVPQGQLLVNEAEEQPSVYIENGVAVIEDRTCFAGSISMGNRLVRTMTKIADVDLPTAVRMAALTPARMLGMDSQIGSIARGKRANLVIFDDDINIENIFVGGVEAPVDTDYRRFR